jgi:hypothetical protein
MLQLDDRIMKFRIVGTNLKTGARVVMDVDAQNRAAAERAATQAGTEVLHVEQVRDPTAEDLLRPDRRGEHRGEHHPKSRIGLWVLLILLGVAIAAGIWLWPRLRGMME